MPANLKVGLLIPMLSLILSVFCPMVSSGKGRLNQVACDVHAGPCSAILSGTKVSLDISPKPVKAMQDLTFTVTLAGEKTVAEPYIDLGMPGMNMGRNRVILKPVGDSVFQGNGVIVRCPSGRRMWKARITVSEIGSMEFIFDVIY